MGYVYCKSHLGVHGVDEHGSTGGGCSVIDEGEVPRDYVPLDADVREAAYDEVRANGWPLYPDTNMDKTWSVTGELIVRQRPGDRFRPVTEDPSARPYSRGENPAEQGPFQRRDR